MSLILGSAAFDAISRLKGSDEWRAFKLALSEQMGKFMHAAIETGDSDACGYARGLRDVVWAIDVIEAGPGNGVIAGRTKPFIRETQIEKLG